MKPESTTPDLRLLMRVALPLVLFVALAPAAAQTRGEVGQRELKRNVPARSVAACSLITRANCRSPRVPGYAFRRALGSMV